MSKMSLQNEKKLLKSSENFSLHFFFLKITTISQFWATSIDNEVEKKIWKFWITVQRVLLLLFRTWISNFLFFKSLDKNWSQNPMMMMMMMPNVCVGTIYRKQKILWGIIMQKKNKKNSFYNEPTETKSSIKLFSKYILKIHNY